MAAGGTEIALAQAAGEYGGMYISHMRNEGDSLLEAFDEFLTIVQEANVAGEIYHLKASGRANWPKLDTLIQRIDEARGRGLAISANMYTYHACSTGLDSTMPPWLQEGGHQAWMQRLRDPAVRARLRTMMNEPSTAWENLYPRFPR